MAMQTATTTTDPACIGRDKRTCFNDSKCYWSGSTCVEAGHASPSHASPSHASPSRATPSPRLPEMNLSSVTNDYGKRGAAMETTPVMYSCKIEGDMQPIEGVTWVDSMKAKTGTAGTLIENVARRERNVSKDTHVTCTIAIQPKHDSREWLHRRMASNCAPRFDLNEVTTINHFQCYYEGTGEIDGKRVRRPFYHIDGRLASCDDYNEYTEISDEVMESIKLYAWHKAGGEEAKMDPDQFVCLVQGLPHH